MKILGIIYLTISVLTFLYVILFGIYVRQEFVKENPDTRFRKVFLMEWLISFLKLIIISFCPILNLLVLLVGVLASERVEETLYDKFCEMTE